MNQYPKIAWTSAECPDIEIVQTGPDSYLAPTAYGGEVLFCDLEEAIREVEADLARQREYQG